MKSTFILAATAISSILGVFGVPATTKSHDAFIYPSPPGVKAPALEKSVNGAPALSRPAASDAEYWVCLAVSPSTLRYGWSQGGSENAALAAAKSYCGQGDCNNYVCVNEGCVAIDFGRNYFAIAYAYGYGQNDGPEAGQFAINICDQHASGCGPANYYCAEYIS
jgi:hypothetical protein